MFKEAKAAGKRTFWHAAELFLASGKPTFWHAVELFVDGTQICPLSSI
jgi:hypothetical protein